MATLKKKIVFLLWLIVVLFVAMPFLSLQANASNPPEITSKYAMLIDADTGMVLYEKNAHDQAFPASTTKIMTGILTIENTNNWEELVTVGTEVNAFGPANSRMEIEIGEEVRVIDLLYGMMLQSGNDAAATLAIHIAGSDEAFADMMNAKAAALGMTGTHFTNAHGIHNKDHYTTAADLAKLAQYAMQNEMFREVVASPSFQTPSTNKHSSGFDIKTTNKFISREEKNLSYNWKPVTGIKTGQTNAAQNCLVSSATQDGKNLICVVLYDASKNGTARWTESRELLQYGFANLQQLSLEELTLDDYQTTVLDASRKDPESGILNLRVKTEGVSISGLMEELDNLKADPSMYKIIYSINNNGQLTAPIYEGQVCGTATLKLDDGTDTTLAVTDLIAMRDIASVESDPKNPVDSLIQNVIVSEGDGISAGTIILLLVLLVIIFLVVVLIIRKRKFDRARARQRARKSTTRQRGYYDYNQRRK